MKSTILESTKVVTKALDECAVSKYEIVENPEWIKVLIDENRYRWIEVYDDSVMIVYKKGFFKRLKYELLLLDWVKDESDLASRLTEGIQRRFLSGQA